MQPTARCSIHRGCVLMGLLRRSFALRSTTALTHVVAAGGREAPSSARWAPPAAPQARQQNPSRGLRMSAGVGAAVATPAQEGAAAPVEEEVVLPTSNESEKLLCIRHSVRLDDCDAHQLRACLSARCCASTAVAAATAAAAAGARNKRCPLRNSGCSARTSWRWLCSGCTRRPRSRSAPGLRTASTTILTCPPSQVGTVPQEAALTDDVRRCCPCRCTARLQHC